MRINILSVGAAITAALFAALSSAWAQEAEASNAAGLITAQQASAMELASLEETFTIFATANEVNAFSHPGAVTVIDRKAIEDYATGTVSDILRSTPGVQFQGGPRRTGDVPSIRGMGGQGVQIFLDGARQSFASGHDGRFFVDPDLLQAVEVIRGPGSALYGSGSLGGVIGFRTVDAADFLDGGDTYGVRVRGAYDSVNEQWSETGTFFYGDADGTFDLVASVTARQSSDIALGNGSDLPSEDDILSSLLKGSWQITPDLSFEASWMRFQNDAAEPNNGQDPTATDTVNKDVESQTLQGTLAYNPQSDLVDFEVTIYGATHDVEEAETTSTRVISRDIESRGIRASNRSRFDLGAAGDVRFTHGGEYYVDEQTGRDSTSVDGTRGGVPDAEATFMGLFAQAEFDFAAPLGAPGTLLIIPGVRYDAFENEAVGNPDTDDSATSYKLAASYLPTDWFLMFGSYAEAFRAPSFDEIYADGVHFPLFLTSPPFIVFNSFMANPNLLPEDSATWEVGAGVDLDGIFGGEDAFRFKGSYWWSDVDNLIGLNVVFNPACVGAPTPPFPPCTDGGTSQYVNTATAELEGLELEAEYDSTMFYASATYSTIDGTDSATGAYVGVLFPDRFFVDAGMRLPHVDGARVGVRAEFAADFDEVNDPLEARDSYNVFDLYAVWEPASRPLHGVRVDLGVDNVGDENYERVFAGTSEPGRNFIAAVSWRTTF